MQDPGVNSDTDKGSTTTNNTERDKHMMFNLFNVCKIIHQQHIKTMTEVVSIIASELHRQHHINSAAVLWSISDLGRFQHRVMSECTSLTDMLTHAAQEDNAIEHNQLVGELYSHLTNGVAKYTQG